ncbi:MAG: DinB family protein [Ferruginibacter sp.]|uniref:DinB family protein n=1 Tax=Ferruginibacter sp. TaxID=1940288 RepID=UPI00265B4F12|nr:DinB family protein [Ferruginibacter sp.]MDB5278046.1 DinB family protein [Ferruginibacter sp.]
MSNILTNAYSKELQSEYTATKKCLERIPDNLYDYKPHPKSMNLGYLSLLVAEIPLWISTAITSGVVDFTTFSHVAPGTSQALLEHFENNFEGAIVALQQATDEALEAPFVLRNGETELMRQTKNECIGSSINHWVHHRGQLTVYMRLNDILVPSIYGPSADDKNY